MIKEIEFTRKGKRFKGVEIRLPGANLIIVLGQKGYVACGYLDLNTASRLGDAACLVSGVKSVKDLLEASVVALTPQAESLGITKGMQVAKALPYLG